MSETTLLNIVFAVQILLLTVVFPLRVLNHIRDVFVQYPPEAYPKLYPRSIESYRRTGKVFRTICTVVFLIGLYILASNMGLVPGPEFILWLATIYFLLQCIPFVYLEKMALQEWKLMRQSKFGRTRKAQLAPRRVLDFIPLPMLLMWFVTNLGFFLFTFYVKTLNLEWFGGVVNLVLMAFMNLLFAAILAWNIFGEKKNPHQDFEDRRRQIRTVASILIFINVAAEIFTMTNVSLKIYDLASYQIVALTVYHIVIGVFGFRSYMFKDSNFEVYKENPGSDCGVPMGVH